MSEPDLSGWSEAALRLLDSLVGLNTHPSVIHRRLMKIGMDVTPRQISDAANRVKEKPKPPPKPKAIMFDIPVIPNRRPIPQPVPPKATNVKPGTFPARNFSMLGGKVK